MILVRPFEMGDQAAIERLATSQNLPYEKPEWGSLDLGAVVERDGAISSAVFLRKTAETYLLIDPAAELRKRERIADLLILHKELVAPAKRAGFSDLHCWVPPELEQRHFGRLLLHLGWTKPLWASYSREIR